MSPKSPKQGRQAGPIPLEQSCPEQSNGQIPAAGGRQWPSSPREPGLWPVWLRLRVGVGICVGEGHRNPRNPSRGSQLGSLASRYLRGSPM